MCNLVSKSTDTNANKISFERISLASSTTADGKRSTCGQQTHQLQSNIREPSSALRDQEYASVKFGQTDQVGKEALSRET